MKYLILALLGLFLYVNAEATIVKVDTTPPTYYGTSGDTKPLNNPGGTIFFETNTGKAFLWTVDKAGVLADWVEWYTPYSKRNNDGGERNTSSTDGTDYTATSEEWRPYPVQTNATGDVIVCPGPSILRMVRVRATNDAGTATSNTVGIILVKDGTTVRDGAAAGKTPGSTIYDGLGGTVFRTNVTINFASASDNPNGANSKLEVDCKPADPKILY